MTFYPWYFKLSENHDTAQIPNKKNKKSKIKKKIAKIKEQISKSGFSFFVVSMFMIYLKKINSCQSISDIFCYIILLFNNAAKIALTIIIQQKTLQSKEQKCIFSFSGSISISMFAFSKKNYPQS